MWLQNLLELYLNEITTASNDGDTILKGFMSGIEEASAELAAPFCR